MKIPVLLLALMLAAGAAFAQPGGKPRDGRGERHMREEDRQRLREDMRGVYRERRGRSERPPPMTPQEREKLRRDIESANRELRRK